jgi:S-adenosylmethionine:tRNA ribosyltransferase-isomerase
MKLSDFDYHLPPELIATKPAKKRDQSRLLVLDKQTGAIEHKHFFDLVDYLKPGDLLVANNSKVIPARLIGKKTTGGVIEIFLSKPLSGSPLRKGREIKGTWECLIKGRVKAGTKIILSKRMEAEIVEVIGEGLSLVKFNLTGKEFMKEVEKIGHIPLPPYIEKRRGAEKELKSDKKNYQTVYAEDLKPGSVAAPTAGLHFTPELIKKIKAQGVGVEYLTLHVGLGTFLPVKTEIIEEHKIHSEYAEVSADLIKKIIETKKKGGRIVAVGTTSARTLEFVFKNLDIKNFSSWVDIFIYPPYKFKVVDALVTNFHLPKSTLLMLVSALAGKKNIDKAYQEAIKAKYRFYSYGDAMFIT